MYWQPNQFKTFEENLRAAKLLKPTVVNVHVFHWDAENRYSMAEGVADWQQYTAVFKDGDHAFMLEFMPDNDIAASAPITPPCAHTLTRSTKNGAPAR